MEITDTCEGILKNFSPHQGRNIVAFRRMKGLTQKELARELGIHQQKISIMETKRTLSDDALAQVAKVLGIDVDILKNYTEDCKISIINENITANDKAQVEIGRSGGSTNYNADKALEVIQAITCNKSRFEEYLLAEIETLKKENKELREKLEKQVGDTL